MRISDWSSDVCSSDLRPRELDAIVQFGGSRFPWRQCDRIERGALLHRRYDPLFRASPVGAAPAHHRRAGELCTERPDPADRARELDRLWSRSEEHTSELQSLMRISYAVFCLKKKKQIQQKTYGT